MSPTTTTSPTVEHVIEQRLVRSVFQPVVALDSRVVVGYEALARGPAGPLERPDLLFAAARQAGLLASLDALCQVTAVRAAVAQGIYAPLTVFINIEPEVLEAGSLSHLLELAQAAPGDMQVVLEITERALAARPAELLATVDRLRASGWRIALDDVGADDMSLAFMPLLRPEVVKLDLRLVQQRPSPAVAQIMNAVNAYAERTGAVLLAEGIETPEHLEVARSLGATLGQGWLFGRPAAEIDRASPVEGLTLPAIRASEAPSASPFDCLPSHITLRRSSKPLLIEVSKHLERQAAREGETSVVAAAFQHARFFSPATRRRFAHLAETTAFVCVLGEGLPVEPVPGVRGASLSPTDPLCLEWDIAVLGPHFAAALLARDLGDAGPDMGRRFEFALTYDRDVVIATARSLLSRVVAAAGQSLQPEARVASPRQTGVSAAGR